jgi:hypothetical protein
VQSSQYDAANQVAGFGYDAAGNLTDDTTGVLATYDALARMTARGGTTYAYNGDGTLVSQVTGGVTTNVERRTENVERRTVSLAAPMPVGSAPSRAARPRRATTHILADTTRTWYATDALGTVRRTLTDAGLPGATLAGACPERSEGTRGARCASGPCPPLGSPASYRTLPAGWCICARW